ncbi:alanine/glycine:cation symporter family protein [Alienimonas chondri]|uniref:Alanine glycine permease n=1 Tax=Alienimonas chondri TaxID=2681879 RepID=A0ABX1V918_9PLAN|nr:alanine/glycine:cation symporter family protein [Alienimonas chondri]NNJ24610.1 hypothetical protein [Alienimonas chondri]
MPFKKSVIAIAVLFIVASIGVPLSAVGASQDRPDDAAEAATEPVAVQGGEEVGEDDDDVIDEDVRAEMDLAEGALPAAAEQEPSGWMQSIDDGAGYIAGKVATVLFYDLSSPFFDPQFNENGDPVLDENGRQVGAPLGLAVVVVMLVTASMFFTVYMGFINFRAFKHAILVTAGKYDDPNDPGEVSHFQALTAALSATVGLGNIAGVAVAVGMGGPGAVLWMICAGFLGMSAKFMECTLGQKYRKVRSDGKIMGGPMYYLKDGLKEMNLGPFGIFLSGLFALLCVWASTMGGNAFQVNQSLGVIGGQIDLLNPETGHPWIYGLFMTVAVGLVILGGITRIAATAAKIVPTMCGVYVAACLFILARNASEVPAAFGEIFSQALNPDAAYGGFLGVLILGFRRAAFSNEAGVGSAAIAHSAAKSEYPVREGVVALLEPFIDTVVVCTMTALVIVITGAYNNPEHAHLAAADGAALTSAAMGEQISWFPYVLSVAVVLFAFSTIISWSYYGERCWCFLFGDKTSIVYRLLFLVFVFLGSIISARNVLELGDLAILGMAVPNLIGVVLLSPGVRRDLTAYWTSYKNGEMDIQNDASRAANNPPAA